MAMRNLPPGRKSICSIISLNGSGANHCIICSGLVQASNTFVRGASMTRVNSSSKAGLVV